MPFFKMVAEHPTLSGLARDEQQNVMHFQTNGSLEDGIETVWDAWYTFMGYLDQWMSDDIFDVVTRATFFDMEDPEPRIPYELRSGAITPAALTSLPLECSMVVSFSGDPASGVNQARRRGRIYLPTPPTTVIQSANGGVAWSTAYRQGVRTAFDTFCETIVADTVPAWLSVYSPTTHAGGASLAASFTTVTRGWVDSEPDTQRRRSWHAGTKELFVVAGA
jgi:hypothetical protein